MVEERESKQNKTHNDEMELIWTDQKKKTQPNKEEEETTTHVLYLHQK